MKNLKTYLEDLYATPTNTIGMGNPSSPSMNNSQVGSGDVPSAICIDSTEGKVRKKRKKFKRYKV